MTPYLILLLFVSVTAYIGRIAVDMNIRRSSLALVWAALVCFAGLRDIGVGTDTGTYISIFNAHEELGSVFNNTDFLYYILAWLARLISDSYWALLFLIATITVTIYLTTIIRIVKRYETGIYLYIALGIYTFFFNAARQSIAASICFAALPFIFQRKIAFYILLVLLASTFHRSALIAIPLYWLASQEIRWTRLVWLGLATAFLVGFLSQFVSLSAELLSDKYASYAEVNEGGGKLTVAFLVGQGALLYCFKNYVSDSDGLYKRLLNIYLIGLVPAVASTLSSVNPSGLLRLQLYFCQVSIIMWPMFFRSIKFYLDYIILSFLFFVLTIIYFILTTINFGNLAPYTINISIF